MAYSTKADLDRAFHPANVIRWADDDNDGSLSADELLNVTAAISEADGMIDAALCGLYDVPVSSPPAIVKRCSVRIAGFLLAKRKGFVTMSGTVEAATIVGDYDDCTKLLAELVAGTRSLPAVDPAVDAIECSTADAEPEFSLTRYNKSTGVAIDSDLDGTLNNF